MSTGPSSSSASAKLGSIWFFALGYFLCYAPYSALTKGLSDGLLPGMDGGGIPGFELLPATVMASLFGMFAYLTITRWWRFAGRRRMAGMDLPWPGRWTFLSGLCTAAIIGTTTLAYTFQGTSIVFMMLLMRGGLLLIAPMVDALSRRKVSWYSWVALMLSFDALLVAFAWKAGFGISAGAALDVAVYLLAYLIRLRFMSRLAKSDDDAAGARYFVEEQMVATPAIVLTLGIVALAGGAIGPIGVQVREGFTGFFHHGKDIVGTALLVGLLSQGTGIFGGLILLDKRENSFCVPVNRASSVLAGIVASYGLWLAFDHKVPGNGEMLGAMFIIQAIFVLAAPTLLEKRAAAKRERAELAARPVAVSKEIRGAVGAR